MGPVQTVTTRRIDKWSQIRPSERHSAATQVEPIQTVALGPNQAVTATPAGTFMAAGGQFFMSADNCARSQIGKITNRMQSVRLNESIGAVGPDDEHEGRGEAIRQARRDGIDCARQYRLDCHR
jgi:hypothetical protein